MQVWPTQIAGVGRVTTWSLIDKGDIISIISFIYYDVGCAGSSLLRAGSLYLWGVRTTLRLGCRGCWLPWLQAFERRLSSFGQSLSCSEACGIFLNQGLNLCLLDWKVDSYPLDHQGSPLDAISSQENLPDTQSGPGPLGRRAVRLQLSPLTK